MRFLDRANALTLLGLAAAFACVLFSMRQLFSIAAVLLMASGICDLFDGMVARSLKRDKEQAAFGARLDSLADVCSFGFAPAILLVGASAGSSFEAVIPLLLLLCVVWRVAYFDTIGLAETPKGETHYIGLPSTYVALVLPAAFVFGLCGAGVLRLTLNVVVLALAGAMVWRVKIPKPRGYWYAVFIAIAVGIGATLLILLPSSIYSEPGSAIDH